MSNYNIDKIYDSNLCLGCGLCEAICGKKSVTMELNNKGFYYPKIHKLKIEDDLIIKNICPAINVINKKKPKNKERIWGHTEAVYEGFSSDSEILKKSSSGGIISSIAIYLLDNNIVDGILHVGAEVDDYKTNRLKISKTREDVIKNSSSRYAPAIIFSDIIKILNKNKDIYCFIGKPCDIAGLNNLILKFPIYKNRIKFKISIVCAGISSYKGTAELINEFKPSYPVRNIKYRGNGWPGYFTFIDNNDKTYSKSYNDSWGKVLNKHLNFRCKICPEGIGILADIVVGDSWETKDGYPIFDERTGKSLIMTRTKLGNELISNVANHNYISINNIDINKLKIIQPFQYERRIYAGSRIIAFYIVKRIKVNFKNLRVFNNLLLGSPKALFLNFMGTFKRAVFK